MSGIPIVGCKQCRYHGPTAKADVGIWCTKRPEYLYMRPEAWTCSEFRHREKQDEEHATIFEEAADG